jgi:hypothetical protein
MLLQYGDNCRARIPGVPVCANRRIRLNAGHVACFLAFFAGCGRTIVSVEDVILRPETTRLTAHVERQPLFAVRRALGGLPIHFLAGDTDLGTAKADPNGRAILEIPTEKIPADCKVIEARAQRDRTISMASARVFDWRDDRVVIAVDVDETICDVEYHSIIFRSRDVESKPMPGALDAMRALAHDFHILYSSARPRFLLEKSRTWIRDRDFPPGPLVGGNRVRDVVRQGALKDEVIRDLQSFLPNMLIGIGDKKADVVAYGKRNMLTLIYAPDGKTYSKDVLVFCNWPAIALFIMANKSVLQDAVQVRRVIAGEIRLENPSSEAVKPAQTRVSGISTASTSRGSSLNSPPP